jgi:hypothetical protein
MQFIQIMAAYFGNRINGTSDVCCRKWDGEGVWTGLIWLRIGKVGEFM